MRDLSPRQASPCIRMQRRHAAAAACWTTVSSATQLLFSFLSRAMRMCAAHAAARARSHCGERLAAPARGRGRPGGRVRPFEAAARRLCAALARPGSGSLWLSGDARSLRSSLPRSLLSLETLSPRTFLPRPRPPYSTPRSAARVCLRVAAVDTEDVYDALHHVLGPLVADTGLRPYHDRVCA